ncbi:MAG TPA: ABC transporter permease subunit, partial [Gemmataceae bacterium]|nr:ABC transporter permease subunit [Gemmataceae bacterium]
MIQALLWKEYREHRAIWLTLTVGGGTCLFGLARLMESDSLMTYHDGVREPLQGLAVLLTWTYGLVCGSILLAGEREEGTMTFLDMLPIRRLQLWLLKCLIGVVLFLGQVAVLTGFLIGLGVGADVWQTALVVLWMVLAGLIGMSWGLLFSARGESVIGTIGLALGGYILSGFVLGILSVPCVAVLAILLPENPYAPVVLGCLAGIIWLASPIVGSARIFSRTDRLRQAGAKGVRGRPDKDVWVSWLRLLWLNYVQMRRLIIGLTIFSLALGFLLPVAGPVVWPIVTLFIGVLCGVTICDDEQAHGSFRFLGDQRFPLGRVWITKLGMRFALAVFATFLLMLPSLILTIYYRIESPSMSERRVPFFGEVLHSCLVGPVVPTAVHLTIWLLYGFSVGQMSGLLFRKSVVAAFAALGVSAMLVSLWVPSLLGIGLHFWQIAGVPLVLLLTAWALVPAWAANRLLARGTFLRLGAAFVAVGLWIAVGLWYRVAEIPDVPDQLDMPAFVAGIPSLDEDKAGQLIRSACAKVESRERALRPPQPNVPNQQRDDFWAQASEVIERGWPDKKPKLAAWLDAILQDNWTAELREVPDLPLGVVADPRRLTIGSLLPQMQASRLLAVVLAVRGLQMQAAGHDEIFADNLG